MKTRPIFIALTIACFSCGTSNKPLSDTQKEKIKGEVKEVVKVITKAAEKANFDNAIESFYDSPDFVYIYNGNFQGYKAFVEATKPMFGTFINQKNTIVDEKYSILDISTVVYSANTKWLIKFKDGHSVLQAPWTVQLIFKKIGGKWKVISGVEGGVEQHVKSNEIPNNLNQLELMKQYLGRMRYEGKDTTIYFDQVDKGKWQETSISFVSKGRLVREGKQLWAYDKKADKIVHMTIIDGVRLSVYTSWFTSKTKYIMIPYSGSSDPLDANSIVLGEFKTPEICTETGIVNGKTIWTETYTRVK